MKLGDFYIADCPFVQRAGSKRRLVVVIREFDDGVTIVESRSREKGNLALLHKIDFDRDTRYLGMRLKGHTGTSHFYLENEQTISKDRFDPERLGVMLPADVKILAEALGLPPLDELPPKTT
jgi:hypothetical protein